MKGKRIMNRGTDMCTREIFLQRITVRRADGILVKHMGVVATYCRGRKRANRRKRGSVGSRDPLACRIPFFKTRQLRQKNARMEFIEPRRIAEKFVVIL